MKKQLKWLTLLLCLMFLMTGCDVEENLGITSESSQTTVQSSPSDISVSSDKKIFNWILYRNIPVNLML